ncbi:MAG: ribosome recycling factor [Deltaproteobacteria bacterium]|nr:ribosome recycling factor [Deltaproteobacteria bacterium]
MNKLVSSCDESMKKRVETLDKELGRVRTGRATVALLDGIRVNYYGTPTPLNQIASLSTPDARTVVVAPYEKKLLGEIEKAIQIADVGIQPNNDGNVIRLPVPPLNEERRKEIAKTVNKIGEDSKVSIRKIRQDFNTQIKKLEKDKEIAEDDSHRLQKEVQTATDQFISMIDGKIEKKKKEVLTM